jgi:hypothetical protein
VYAEVAASWSIKEQRVMKNIMFVMVLLAASLVAGNASAAVVQLTDAALMSFADGGTGTLASIVDIAGNPGVQYNVTWPTSTSNTFLTLYGSPLTNSGVLGNTWSIKLDNPDTGGMSDGAGKWARLANYSYNPTLEEYAWSYGAISYMWNWDAPLTLTLDIPVNTSVIGLQVGRLAADPEPSARSFQVVSEPVPADYALKVSVNPTLSWSVGAKALTYDVFFGTDSNTVSNATQASPEFKGNYGVTNYAPGTLTSGQTYYWRVDERNNDSSVTKGATLTFTTNYTVAPGIASPLYVAPDGNDNGNGSFSQPFRTIERARDAVRILVGNGLTGSVVVNIRGGTYYLANTLTFTTADSGTDTYSITYQAYQRERVIISGGKTIGGWTSIGSNKYTVTLPDVSNGSRKFRHLWCNGERCQRSRWPNPGSFASLLKITAVSADKKTLTMNKTLSGSSPYGNGTEYMMYNYFNSDRAMVSSISGSSVTTVTEAGIPGGGQCFEPEAGLLGYLENNPDYIDQATEWSLNPGTGFLTYQAPAGVNPANCTFVVPRLQQLVAITGTISTQVKNIIFNGLSFQHAGWDLPAAGFGGMQAGYYGASYIIPPAILISYASNCQLQRCYVANIGCSGIGFGAKCSQNIINDCEIYDISGTGVHSGYQGNASGAVVTWPSMYAPYHNVISNNYIHGIGVEWVDCVGIFDSFCDGTQIIHNTITSTSYSGISAGFSWDAINPQVEKNAVIQYNHIYDVMRILNDGGGIYLNGHQGNAQIIGNLFHDVHIGWRTDYPTFASALFFDAGTYCYIGDNIAYNIDGGTYIRMNPDEQTVLSRTTWGTNYWGVPYPQSIADNAGPILPTPVSIGWWKFDEAGGAAANDFSGFGYDGTNNGAAHVTGKLGNALSFDGVNNNVTVSSGVLKPLYKQVTISLWQYGDESQPRQNVLLQADNAAGRVLQIYIPWSDGTVYWDAGNDILGNVDRISKAANAGDYEGKWNHWVFTKNAASGNQKIYLNGSLWQSGTGKTLPMDGAISSLYIGSASVSGGGYPYKGKIDDVQMYDRELSAAQVRQIYVDGKRNGMSDFNDLAELAAHWLGNDPAADIAPPPSGDGVVDFLDFAGIAVNWLESTP